MSLQFFVGKKTSGIDKYSQTIDPKVNDSLISISWTTYGLRHDRDLCLTTRLFVPGTLQPSVPTSLTHLELPVIDV